MLSIMYSAAAMWAALYSANASSSLQKSKSVSFTTSHQRCHLGTCLVLTTMTGKASVGPPSPAAPARQSQQPDSRLHIGDCIVVQNSHWTALFPNKCHTLNQVCT